jgi:hypothetical protein
MKLDWAILRAPLALLTISVVVSMILLSLASHYNDGQLSVTSNIDRQLIQAKRRYSEARRDSALYQRYLESYIAYTNKGIIGQEQRLDWIEKLQEISRNMKLASLKYEISPQKPVDIAGMHLRGNISVNASAMHLIVGLVHEGDSVRLFRALRNSANGFFSLQECEMVSRITDQHLHYRPNVANVNLDCKLNWYTISVKS